MPYATIQDMIDRFGTTEMIRLTVPEGQPLDRIAVEVALTRLNDASVLIDSFVGRRYKTPMDLPPPVIVSACCTLARYDLATGEQKSPTEQMKDAGRETMEWLKQISLGQVVLELDEVEAGDESYAQASTRGQVFGAGGW